MYISFLKPNDLTTNVVLLTFLQKNILHTKGGQETNSWVILFDLWDAVLITRLRAAFMLYVKNMLRSFGRGYREMGWVFKDSVMLQFKLFYQ